MSNSTYMVKYRMTQAGKDALKRAHAKQALAREAQRNEMQNEIHRGAKFAYKSRGMAVEVRHCKWCGVELKGKRRLIDYCDTICMCKEFDRAYHQGEKAK